MRLIADLHIHSRFSRATSKDLTLPSLHWSALEKGISLVGTGDFTHPGWIEEIRTYLEPAEEGLFRLRRPYVDEFGSNHPSFEGPVRFVLQVEISNIYKRDGEVHKVHNLVYMPSLEAAGRFNSRLERIGNLRADGRPILGLDSRDLLEITLEVDPRAFLIPAHVWTPWFSMLGSKSGFEHSDACFGDLSSHVFAIETGLSSDPPMNWRVSALDRFRLVSNSDAHSASKLGREATCFDIELSYDALLAALRTGKGYAGTLEFFPEEGKYHLDGHRACDLRLEPAETKKLSGRCPKCGGLLTIGVLSRVNELADRAEAERPATGADFKSLVPLEEVVAECHGVGVGSKQVQTTLRRLLSSLGNELHILLSASLEDIRKTAGPVLAEAISRVRDGQLCIEAGYDGEYGTVRIFTTQERQGLMGQTLFAGMSQATGTPPKRAASTQLPLLTFKTPAEIATVQDSPHECKLPPTPPALSAHLLERLDAAQRAAAERREGPLLITAGPGTGKTRTLAVRIAYQISSGWVEPQKILALSFTRQAVEELTERLRFLLPPETLEGVLVTTFHGLGLRILQDLLGQEVVLLSPDERETLLKQAVEGQDARAAKSIGDRISATKQSPSPTLEPEALKETIERYEKLKRALGKRDIDDLVLEACQRLQAEERGADQWLNRYASISVDEYQDINDVQAALVSLLARDGRNLCVIGDPNQAIYGFRGSQPGHFSRFTATYADACAIRLETTYRLPRPILEAASALLGTRGQLHTTKEGPGVSLAACPGELGEAITIVEQIERLVGGTSHRQIEGLSSAEDTVERVGFGEIAILTRLKVQQRAIVKALEQAGIPYRVVSEDEPHDPRSQKIAVMTLHASKGREFDVVFIPGLEPDILPLSLPGFVTEAEEERRLLYVGMTRARRRLLLSYSRRRLLFGRRLPGGLSPLLRGLSLESLNIDHTRRLERSDRQLSLI